MKLFELHQPKAEDQTTKILGAIHEAALNAGTKLISVDDIDKTFSEDLVEELGRLHRSDKIIYNPKLQTIGLVDF